MSIIESDSFRYRVLISAFGVSLFATLFLWRFWSYGIEVLGINSILFSFLIIGFFIYSQRNRLKKDSLSWLVPIGLIALSMGIYTNAFTKTVSLSVLPVCFFIFATHEIHANIRKTLWSKYMIGELLDSGIKYVKSVFGSVKLFRFRKRSALSRLSSGRKEVLKQIGLGLVVLIILLGFIIIPLLSSADSEFAKTLHGIFQHILNILDWPIELVRKIFRASFVYRVLLTGLGMVLLLGFALYLEDPLNIRPTPEDSKSAERYSVAVGIVLAGVLVIYLLFIAIQIRTLFVSSLPTDFSNTERLVKTGFWQLFLLTIINILFYIGIYNRSTKKIQRILSAFTMASMLLIFSAAYKTYLYVVTYGLSFEKFYALYTVIFCVGVFIWFLSLFVRNSHEVHIVRNLAFAALWMYALSTIVPLESVIFSTNLSLTQHSGSRVNILELKMLGFDAIPAVDRHFSQLIFETEADNTDIKDIRFDKEWLAWRQNRILQSEFLRDNYYIPEKKTIGSVPKAWYEKTLTELIYNSKAIPF
jgi:hypothetical protein